VNFLDADDLSGKDLAEIDFFSCPARCAGVAAN
jgi:hypothetical protein